MMKNMLAGFVMGLCLGLAFSLDGLVALMQKLYWLLWASPKTFTLADTTAGGIGVLTWQCK
jgi:hypothetical protein